MPYEGGLSLLLKFAWANCASAADICHAVFGRNLLRPCGTQRQGRSLLDVSWDSGRPDVGLGRMRALCRQGALGALAGQWAPKIASDFRIRYCSACMQAGYQCAFYQIDALTCCPIHGEALRHVCMHCGTDMPPYAIVHDAFISPFFCPQCDHPYAGAPPDAARWGDPALRLRVEHAIAPLANWVRRIGNAGMHWRRWEEWALPAGSSTTGLMRRTATVQVLASIISPGPSLAFSEVRDWRYPIYRGGKVPSIRDIQPYALTRLTPQETNERCRIYKAIRRQLERRYGRLCPEKPSGRVLRWADYVSHNTFHPRKEANLYQQAVLLWRFRMENHPHNDREAALRLPVLNWPLDGMADANAWAGFALAGFHAATASVAAWLARAQDVTETDPLGNDRVHAMELYGEFEPVFNPALVPIFPSITEIEFAGTQSGRPVAVIAPAVRQDSQETGVSCTPTVTYDTFTLTTGSPVQSAAATQAEAGQPSGDDVRAEFIRPLDELVLPTELDGSGLSVRRVRSGCTVDAANDIEAIRAYLAQCASANTARMYRTQIEKCLVWSVAQCHQPLSAMRTEDAQRFIDFLHTLQPREVWLSGHRSKQLSGHWSPFRSIPLQRTCDYTICAVSSLFAWWQAHGYIETNPWRNLPFAYVGRRPKQAAPLSTHPSLPPSAFAQADWQRLRHAIGQIDDPQVGAALELVINLVVSRC